MQCSPQHLEPAQKISRFEIVKIGKTRATPKRTRTHSHTAGSVFLRVLRMRRFVLNDPLRPHRVGYVLISEQ
ncbi:hypothetical protein Pla52n_64740 [Stieleria varia]|uniref:Uncharacterized protein n=1 Tax=Stieleria varia TaxID=2528005 RepID=A0A5C5ZYG5_9BACT|nr:hypothetical protein Pla52n_64740 [Stieleria varia]